MVLTVIVISVSVILAAIYIWIKKSFSYWEKRKVPFVKPSFPFGNFKGIGKIHTAYINKRLYDEIKAKSSQTIAGLYIFTNPAVLIMDPDLRKTILVRDFNNFEGRGIYYNEKDDPLSAHLISIDGLKWKNLRAKISPTFTTGKMKMMFQSVSKVGDEFQNHLKEIASKNNEIEIKDISSRYTIDVIGTCAFGIECNSIQNPNAEFKKMGTKISKSSLVQQLKFIFSVSFRRLADLLSVVITEKSVSDFFLSAITETVNQREKNSIERNDFMNLMIKLKNHENLDERLTINELAAQAFVFFVAGFETSANAISFCLYELALNQDIQDKLRNEIRASIGRHNGEISYESISDIPYLDQVIDETLRKYPAVETMNRITGNDYKIPNSNHLIKKGTVVALPVYAVHHDPEIYPDPETFDPERFSEENKKLRHPFNYLPFGEGPRICIGLRFGIMQTRIGVIKALLGCKFSPSEKTPNTIVFDPNAFIPTHQDDLWLKIEKI